MRWRPRPTPRGLAALRACLLRTHWDFRFGTLWDSVQEDWESGLRTCSGFGFGTLWGSLQADRRWVSSGPTGVLALGHCGVGSG